MKLYFVMASALAFSVALLAANTIFSNVFAADTPDINATNIFNGQSAILGKNVDTLFILIPNEAHEPPGQPKGKGPLMNEPYFPFSAVVNKGTSVVWFNGDADHRHTINFEGSMAKMDVAKFDFNSSTEPLVFDQTGTFNYSESKVNKDDPSFVMKGQVKVIDQPLSVDLNSNQAATDNASNSAIGGFMVPAKDLEKYTSEFVKNGFAINSTHTFKDERGGQKGTGPEQTIIIWTTSGKSIDEITKVLQDITAQLPYS